MLRAILLEGIFASRPCNHLALFPGEKEITPPPRKDGEREQDHRRN